MEQAVEDAWWTAAFKGTLLTFWGVVVPLPWERLCGKEHALYPQLWGGRESILEWSELDPDGFPKEVPITNLPPLF